MRTMSRRALLSATVLALAAAVLPAVGADEISHDQLMHMIQSAKTPADHQKIAAVYEQQARDDQAAAEKHQSMERMYRGIDPTGGGRGSGQMAAHCKRIADDYSRAAKEHSQLAKLHRDAAASAQ